MPSPQNVQVKAGIAYLKPERITVVDAQCSNTSKVVRWFRNPRTNFKPQSMESLRESIRKQGLHQNPGVCITSSTKNADAELIWGERRLRCILKLKEDDAKCYDPSCDVWSSAKEVYDTVACKVRTPKTDFDALSMAISENMEQDPLTDWEWAILLRELINSREHTRFQIEKLFGRSQSWITQTLKLLELPKSVQNLLQRNIISKTSALMVAPLQSGRELDKVLQRARDIARKEATEKADQAEEEYENMQTKLDMAEVATIHAQISNSTTAKQQAAKAVKKAEKKAKNAQEKAKTAKTKANSDELTVSQDSITRALSERPLNSFAGKPKPISTKSIRNFQKVLRGKIGEVGNRKKVDNYSVSDLKIIDKTLDMILGHIHLDAYAVLDASKE